MAKNSLAKPDKWFSLYIRLRDADKEGNVTCCSCGKTFYWRDVDAGHFIPRQHRATRYNERNVHSQCRKCNRFDNGNPAGYALFLIEKYGSGVLEELKVASHGATRWTKFEINNMAEAFKARAVELAHQKDLVI